MRKTYSPEQIAEAVARIQAGESAAVVAAELGAPKATVRSWVFRAKGGKDPDRVATQDVATAASVATETLQQRLSERMEGVAERVAALVEERQKALAKKLLDVAEEAIKEVRASMGKVQGKPGDSHDRDGAAWLRSLVGVMAQAVEKAQLLSGKPTGRLGVEGKVTSRYEYDLTQRIISDPEATELAEQLLRRAAGRDPSSLRLDGE